MLTPLDVHNQKFSRAIFGGYKAEEVDDFCEQIAKDYESIYRENHELKEELEKMQNKIEAYAEMEEHLKKTLVVAQTTAEEIRKNALKEKELIIQEANQEAQKIVDAAISEGKRIEREYEHLRQQAEFFFVRFRTLLETHLKMLNEEAQKIENEESQKLEGETQRIENVG
ncbi:MAG TPA: DivIVA domain-containing protein [Clostridia bacterium]|nr:DivIVA domain-containing protein [Clostridia bacterium]